MMELEIKHKTSFLLKKHIAKKVDGKLVLTLCGKVKLDRDVASDRESEVVVCVKCRQVQSMMMFKVLGGNGYMKMKEKKVTVKGW